VNSCYASFSTAASNRPQNSVRTASEQFCGSVRAERFPSLSVTASWTANSHRRQFELPSGSPTIRVARFAHFFSSA